MDWLAISIIVISVLLAFLFKFVLLKRIREWIDRDLLQNLSSGDATKFEQLSKLDSQLKAEGVSRTVRHQQLEQLAKNLG